MSPERSCQMLKKNTNQNKNHEAQNMLMVKLKDLFTLYCFVAFNSCIIERIHTRGGGMRRRIADDICDITTGAISVYHHYSCEIAPRSLRRVFDTTLCDNVCQ